MKTVKNLKLKFTATLTALVVTATANALPPRNGSLVINEKYGHECFDPEAAMPANAAMSTMTSSMNCNSIPDPVKFCECVDIIAEPLGIDNYNEEFKRAFIQANLFKNQRNFDIGIGIKFRDEFLNGLILTEDLDEEFIGEKGCGTFERHDLDENPIANRVNDRFNKELVEIMNFGKRRGKNGDESRRVAATARTDVPNANREDWQKRREELNAQINTNSDSLRRAKAIEKENNRKAVSRIIQYMATTESNPGSGRSIAKEFINPEVVNTMQQQTASKDLFNLTASGSLVESAATNASDVFKRVLVDLQDDPAIKSSSLGMSPDKNLMNDINQVFQTMVETSLQEEKFARMINVEKVLKEDEFNGENVQDLVNQIFERSIKDQIWERCVRLRHDYSKFLEAFKENGHHTEAFSYQDAEREYNDTYNSGDLSEETINTAERTYRRMERMLSSDFGKTFTDEPHKLMVAIDLNYCNTPPTSPKANVIMEAKLASVKAEEAEEYGMASATDHLNADSGRFPASAPVRRVNVEELSDDLYIALDLDNQYKQAIALYDSTSMKRTQLEFELEKEKRALRALEQDPGSDTSLKNHARNRISTLTGEIEAAKILEANAKDKVDEAHDKYSEHDRMSFRKHGKHYRDRMDANLGHLVDNNECYKRYIENEKGELIPNPNWAKEAAACQAKIQQQLLSELDVKVTPPNLNNGSSYYSTNAQDNIDLSTKRTEARDNRFTLANEVTVQELERIGDDLGKSFVKSRRLSDSSTKRPKKRPDNINSQNNALKNSSSKEDSDPFATEKEFNEKEIERLEKLNDSSLAESGLEKGFDEERIQARKSKNTDSTLPDNEVGEKFTQIAETLGQLPGVDGKNTSGQSSDGKVKSTSKIQKEAEAIIEREEELKRAQAKIEAQKQEDAKIAANANTAAISPEYEKLLAEVKALREQNLELQKGVTSMTEQRKAEVVAADNAQRRQATIEQQVANEAEINNPQNFENQGFAASGRSPASDNSAERTQIVNNGVKKANAVVNNGNSAPANVAANQNKVATVTPLPTPTSRGGELQNATVALNSAISLEAKALPILSGVDQSREILTGNEGLNGYLNLVGSKNELTMDSFNEIRLDPAKFAQFEIDSSQPIIIKTPNGHMVMLAVVEGDQVKGFRYVKEIKPEHVERRIASEQEEILEEKRRIIYEANLDALFEETTK